jgi:hypothetical protein
VDVFLLHAGDLGMHQIAAFLLPDVDLHRRSLGLGAVVDRADEEAAEQIIKRVASDQAVHFSLLSFKYVTSTWSGGPLAGM